VKTDCGAPEGVARIRDALIQTATLRPKTSNHEAHNEGSALPQSIDSQKLF
jgi:hypothetical protein